MDQSRSHKLDHTYPHSHPRTNPTTCPERYHLEIVPFHVNVGLFPTGQEAFGPELQWVGPHIGVAAYGPDVDEKRGPLGNDVAVDRARLVGHSGYRERGGGVESEILLDDGLEEWHVGQVGFGDEAVLAHYRVKFLSGLGQDSWIS